MKTLILIISVMALGVMGVGCSKSNSNAAAPTNTVNPGQLGTPGTPTNPANPVIVDPIGPGGSGDPSVFSSGFTTKFTPVNFQTMMNYVSVPGIVPALNNPQNIQINLNLAQAGTGRYGGAISISYTDNGVQHMGVFRAGMGKNYVGNNMYDNDKLQADYNYWFDFENELVFTGFFEDSYGVITVTLTPEPSTGGGNDAEPLNVTYKGSIYFKNFQTEKNNPYRSCWFIYSGPFDCRSNVIQTKCGLTPGPEAGYTMLGTFTGVDIKKAFNIN